MRRLVTAAALGVVAVAAAALGCGRTAPALDQPPAIAWGEDLCDECHMIISDPRYAASLVTRDGTVRRFDGVGELVAYVGRGGRQPGALWVHDLESDRWLPAASAVYVDSPSFQTPMGHGVVAVASRERAEALAREHHGAALSWAELVSGTSVAATTDDRARSR